MCIYLLLYTNESQHSLLKSNRKWDCDSPPAICFTFYLALNNVTLKRKQQRTHVLTFEPTTLRAIHRLYKNNVCSHCDVTRWFVDSRFEASSLVFWPSLSFIFGARNDKKWPHLDESVELGRSSPASNYNTSNMVATCESQGSNALKHTLLYCQI